ncbi:pantoate--beta-alanine ligase [Actinomadura roseirufa]|uniref:pantoate--beta-alanine ligase n=1 Tax=Actinomadura roseirufa TaxID=2094049 RepID=UPI0010411ADC|nr:pantoate--beta-alanine ligase [Actinomadura roseirufa]
MPPVIARTREELAAVRSGARGALALVPTMGALHEGHRSLIRRARAEAGAETGTVVVSVFVNPLQFGPGEDFDRYPRTLAADLAVCAEEGVDAVFAPGREVMYPAEPEVTVRAGTMGERVEGVTRPGHFDGMLTVVLKLFNLVRPDLAVFGEKDAQQLAMIRRMVADLDVPVRIVGAPTVREPDGLALSSRNRYLSAAERATALALSRALRAGADAAADGPAAILAAARGVLDAAAAAEPPLAPDYLVLVDPVTFTEITGPHEGPAVLAVAGRVGATHLIDNVHLQPGPAKEH